MEEKRISLRFQMNNELDLKAWELLEEAAKKKNASKNSIVIGLILAALEHENSDDARAERIAELVVKINPDLSLDIVKKDVDFCIGKKVEITIEHQSPITLTLPIVSVEVKTYLDATMFGEVKSSSKTLKSATPNSKAYVLMGYKCLADEHIIAARQDSTLDELFVLRKGEGQPIDPYALYMYWLEIVGAIRNLTSDNTLTVPGRLLAYNNMYLQMVEEDRNKKKNQ